MSSMLSRRDLLRWLAGVAVADVAGAAPATRKSPFLARLTMETGWNIFFRKGYSTAPKDIEVNYKHLDYLHEAGLNWLLVFWTNAPEFDDAWQKAAEHAHSLGLRVGRGFYGFCGGGAETTMAEPNVPERLLRPNRRGQKTALCPHDPETRDWIAKALADRIKPDIDGLLIEPAREIGRNCACERCRALRPFQWDTFAVNSIAEHLLLKPGIEIMLHLNTEGTDKAAKRIMAADLAGVNGSIKYIFGWGTDDEAKLVDWLDADRRFQAFTKLSRVHLFPGGAVPRTPARDRAARVFRWCRLAADRGKEAYSFDWRIFGGCEWKGHEKELPTTRRYRRIPASIALMGAALQDPYLDETQQCELLKKLRADSEWDLDDPKVFYRGA